MEETHKNSTDPFVVFDPKYEKTPIAKTYLPDDRVGANIPAADKNNSHLDYTTIDAIKTPLVKINTQVLDGSNIKYMKLSYTDFKPSLELIINNLECVKLSAPGMANKVTLVIIPAVDGTYRKISIDFYIVSLKEIGGNIRLYCEYFFPELERKYTKVIKSSESNKLSTYSLLESIASACQLGFSCTSKCKDINDNKIRLMRNQNYQEVLAEHIKFSGTGDNSIFVSWIDLYGYITLCNLSWVLNSSIQSNELSIKRMTGMNIGSNVEFKSNPIKYGEDTIRSFTNWKLNTSPQDNIIKSYKWIVDNSIIKLNGTDNVYYALEHLGSGKMNNISSEEITIKENSTDGENFTNAYRFQKSSYIGTEMGNIKDGNTPVLYQEKRRDAFLSKVRSKKLMIQLKNINFGLARGMLINLEIFEYDRYVKSRMLSELDNIRHGGDRNIEPSDAFDNRENIINDGNIGVPNLSVSGIYFIDGMDILFDELNGYTQILYLIRQSEFVNYSNLSSMPKL